MPPRTLRPVRLGFPAGHTREYQRLGLIRAAAKGEGEVICQHLVIVSCVPDVFVFLSASNKGVWVALGTEIFFRRVLVQFRLAWTDIGRRFRFQRRRNLLPLLPLRFSFFLLLLLFHLLAESIAEDAIVARIADP